MEENYLNNRKEVLNAKWTLNSVMNRIKQKLTSLTKTTNVDPNMETGRRKTCNIVRGRNIFKGNTLNIWSHTDDITIANSYYMNSVVQRYSKTKDITTVDYHIFSKRGKWTNDLIKMYIAKDSKNVIPVHNGMILNLPGKLLKEYNHKNVSICKAEMRLTEWGDINTTLSLEYNKPGINFSNNWENIDTIKRLSKIVSFILNHIKKNQDIILNKNPEPCTDMHAYNINLTLKDLNL